MINWYSEPIRGGFLGKIIEIETSSAKLSKIPVSAADCARHSEFNCTVNDQNNFTIILSYLVIISTQNQIRNNRELAGNCLKNMFYS
jgi:hypothetical protein